MGRVDDEIGRFSTHRWDVALAELASRQHGVVALAQPRRLAAVFAAGLGAAVSHRTAADLLVDLADVLPGEALARAVNEAEVRRLFDARAVETALERASGRRGATNLAPS